MSLNLNSRGIFLSVILFSVLFLIGEVEARRLAGGGGKTLSRSGPAAGGGFSARSSQRMSPQIQRQPSRDNRQASRQPSASDRQSDRGDRQERRQDNAGDRQERRQENAGDRQEHRQEHYDDWDDHHDRWDDNDGEFLAGAIVGAAVVGAATSSTTTTNYITVLPCDATTVAVDGVTYYKCDSTWYQRAHTGDQVSYIISGPPAGL